LAEPSFVAAELLDQAALNSEPDVWHTEVVPLTGMWSRGRFEEEMPGGEATQCARRSAITAAVGEFAFFPR
jgi:hypothetical protein